MCWGLSSGLGSWGADFSQAGGGGSSAPHYLFTHPVVLSLLGTPRSQPPSCCPSWWECCPEARRREVGGQREVQGCSQHWAAPAWRWELAPCWPVERDISSNATKGLPDLHSPARTPFLPPSGLFITVLTGKRPCQPSPGPALCVSPGSRGRRHINRTKEHGHCRTPENTSRRSVRLHFLGCCCFRSLGLFNTCFYFVVVKYA